MWVPGEAAGVEVASVASPGSVSAHGISVCTCVWGLVHTCGSMCN